MEFIYFIRHKGMSPIKIGRTTNLNKRLTAFKNASPYGVEIIGVIETNNAPQLESMFHKKFKSFRLNGEWFSIDERIILDNIAIYKNKNYIDLKNKFELNFIEPKQSIEILDLSNNYNISKGYVIEKVMNLKELKERFELEIKKIKSAMEYLGIKYQAHRVDGKVKAGYKVFLKNNEQ